MKILIQLNIKSKAKLMSLMAGLLLMLLSTPDYAASVIVNSSSGADAVSLSEVRAIFSMRLRRWPNGLPVTVYILKSDSVTHSDFCKNILNIYPHQLQATWDRMVYSGTGKAPIVVNSEAEMREMVAATPGAIGYVAEAKLDDLRIKEINLR
ncbi:MAG TPA: hypothetical protein VFM46_13850 [Pseudomonadales bacterium]|nr:hypothetical protein [Pseudomonadales bacterium]